MIYIAEGAQTRKRPFFGPSAFVASREKAVLNPRHPVEKVRPSVLLLPPAHRSRPREQRGSRTGLFSPLPPHRVAYPVGLYSPLPSLYANTTECPAWLLEGHPLQQWQTALRRICRCYEPSKRASEKSSPPFSESEDVDVNFQNHCMHHRSGTSALSLARPVPVPVTHTHTHTRRRARISTRSLARRTRTSTHSVGSPPAACVPTSPRQPLAQP